MVELPMSKAFTREESDGPGLPEITPLPSALPPGARNLMTEDGAERLGAELAHLIQGERPSLAAEKSDLDAKRRLALLDQRILQLQQSLETAEVISPPEGAAKSVTFGATVKIRGQEGEEVFRIVGVDETDQDRGRISYLSPVARALMNARVGQSVEFRYPCGGETVQVLDIRYE
jgi:transcription elongation factor GreB